MGESARKPGCPEFALTPLELLTPGPDDGFSAFEKWAFPVVGAVGGAGFNILRNSMIKRPLWAGFPITLLSSAGLAYFMIVCRDIKFAARAEADEVYKHYISLHPEDFPPFVLRTGATAFVAFASLISQCGDLPPLQLKIIRRAPVYQVF